RVKKLEKKDRSRTHKLKRLYKVGLSTRVESSKDEGLGEEDASKQGMIADINANKDIYLVNVHTDEDMFGVNDLDGDEIIAKLVSATKETVNVAAITVRTASTIPKQAPTPTVSSQQPSHVKVQDKGKGKMVEPEPVKKMSKKDLLRLDEELAFKLQDGMKRRRKACQEKLKQMEEANIAWMMFRQKLSAGRESKEAETDLEENLKECMKAEVMEFRNLKLSKVILDEVEVAIDVVPLATKPPTIVDWKIHKEGKNNYYQIIRADGSSKMYMVFSQILKIFDMQYLEDLYMLSVFLGSFMDSCGVHSSRMNMCHYIVGRREEISPYTSYNYRYAEQEASR
ncbi:hypothetical protein Tco_0947447, partial [Tanacetum coccineum]